MKKLIFIIWLLSFLFPYDTFGQGACFITDCTKAGITATNGIQLANKSAGAISILQNINGTAKGLTIAATSGNATFDGSVTSAGQSSSTTCTCGTGLTVTTGGATVSAGDVTVTAGNVIFSGAQKGIRNNIATLAALGTNQATCAPIVSTIARVTAADGTVGVCLPAGAAGLIGARITVINSDVTNALKVYAAGAETITGQAGSTAISVAAKLILECVLYDATNWYCAKTVTPY